MAGTPGPGAGASDLAACAGLSGVGDEALRALLAAGRPRVLAAGERLFDAGEDYGGAIYLVTRGALELRDPAGDTVDVGCGGFAGLLDYIDRAPHALTAIAPAGAEVLELKADALEALERRFPDLADLVNRAIAARLRAPDTRRRTLSGVMAQPVRAFMKAPLATCAPQTTLRDACATMHQRKFGSLGVVDAGGGLIGLLTTEGVAEAVVLQGRRPDDPVADALTGLAPTIDSDEPLWRAEEAHQAHGVKYIVVMEDGAPVGMVSQTDILRSLLTSQSRLIDRIGEADDLGDLRRFYVNIADTAMAARETNRLPSTAVRVVSETHRAIQRRCVELTLAGIEAEGRGAAPARFAVLIMGSGGRREMMLDPDQDNGIVMEDGEAAARPEASAWFEAFCDRLNVNLDKVGYVLCPGDIMARNPMFRKTLGQWKSQISHMARFPNEKAARWSNIVFDFDTLHGDDALTAELRAHVNAELKARPGLLGFMVAQDAEGRPSIGWFNRLITASDEERKGKVDIKRNGLRIIADAARIFALANGIGSTNTNDRLRALVREGVLSSDMADSVTAAYEELLDLLMVHQSGQRRRGEALDKLVDPKDLSAYQVDVLKDSMRAVKRLQDLLHGRHGLVNF